MRASKNPFVGPSVFLSVSGLLLCAGVHPGTAASGVPRFLSDQEMHETLGGQGMHVLGINGGTQGVDNLVTSMTITNQFGTNSIYVETYIGATKTGSVIASTPYPNGPGPGCTSCTWGYAQFRQINYPLGLSGSQTLQVKYCGGSPSVCGNATGASTTIVSLAPETKVRKVKVYNTSDGVEATSVGSDVIRPQLDNTAYTWTPGTTASADLTLDKCVFNDQWQMRYHSLEYKTVPAGCTNLYIAGEVFGQEGPMGNYTSCMNSFYGLSANSPNAYLNVYLVNSINSWSVTTNSYSTQGAIYATPTTAVPFKHRLMFMLDSMSPYFMATTYTHEMYHAFSTAHTTGSSCTGASASRNFMCSAGGENVTAAQCTTMLNNTAVGGTTNFYTDYN